MRTLLSILISALLLAGCATHGPAPKPQPPAQPAPPAAAPAPAPIPPAPPPHVPSAAEKAAAQDRALQAAELLQDAKVAETRIELQRSLKLDPHNVLATTLLRQLDEDPTAILGKESFQYKVVPGDTLSRIADRVLGDKYMFYALARYNNIATPRQLQAGQLIKILGKQPPPPKEVRKEPRPPAPPENQPAQLPATSPLAVRACDNAMQLYKAADQQRAAGKSEKFLELLDKSHDSYRECGRLGAQSPELMARHEQLKRPLADGYYREAMKAHYDQEMDLAIHLFQRVLDVDPEHSLAAENLRKDKDLLRKACRIDPTPPACRTINARFDRDAIAPG